MIDDSMYLHCQQQQHHLQCWSPQEHPTRRSATTNGLTSSSTFWCITLSKDHINSKLVWWWCREQTTTAHYTTSSWQVHQTHVCTLLPHGLQICGELECGVVFKKVPSHCLGWRYSTDDGQQQQPQRVVPCKRRIGCRWGSFFGQASPQCCTGPVAWRWSLSRPQPFGLHSGHSPTMPSTTGSQPHVQNCKQ